MAKSGVKYFLVDAFTAAPFKGNPAAVCFLEERKDDEWLQSVAREFNISQTCFLTPIADSGSAVPRFRLRWFTPVVEVKLCGHATLAAAHTLFSSDLVDSIAIEFITLSGVLTAKRVVESTEKDPSFSIELNFPASSILECESPDYKLISKAFNTAVAAVVEVKTTLPDNDLLVVLQTGKDVADLQPNFHEISRYPGRGVIVTGAAPEETGFHFVSRFFCPKFGIPEDPVCGSVHCALTTYWSEKLGKTDLVAYQASPRGGVLGLRMDKLNKRVSLTGKAVTVMTGYILV